MKGNCWNSGYQLTYILFMHTNNYINVNIYIHNKELISYWINLVYFKHEHLKIKFTDAMKANESYGISGWIVKSFQVIPLMIYWWL